MSKQRRIGYKLPNSSWAYVHIVEHPNGDGYLFDEDTGHQMSVNGQSVFSCPDEAYNVAYKALSALRA